MTDAPAASAAATAAAPGAATAILALDGGATRTRMVVLTVDGERCGAATGPASNVDHVAPTELAVRWASMRDVACAAAGVDPGAVRTAMLGVAGVTTHLDRERVRTAATAARLAPTVSIDHDGAIGVEGAHLGGPGLLLIAGTGSACYGRGAVGGTFRIGGWGHWIGDEGSATWIGQEGLRAVAWAIDGRGPSTLLVEEAMMALRIDDPDAILHALYLERDPRVASGSFAPQVLQAASRGDAVAADVVDRAGEALAQLVAAGVAALSSSDAVDAPAVATVGGAIDDEVLKGAWTRALVRLSVPVRHVEAAFPPVLGAASLALLREGLARADVDARLTTVHAQVRRDLASNPEVTIP